MQHATTILNRFNPYIAVSLFLPPAWQGKWTGARLSHPYDAITLAGALNVSHCFTHVREKSLGQPQGRHSSDQSQDTDYNQR